MEIEVNERLLGMMAVEKRLITEKQLTECLNLHDFFDQRAITAIMVEKGYVSERQVEKMKAIMRREIAGEERPPVSKDRFGILALRSRLIKLEQLDPALKEQKDLAEAGLRLPIGQILMSRGILTPDQVARVLLQQGKGYLACEKCHKAFTVVNFDPDEFYRCQKCGDFLEESLPVPIPRAKIEGRLRPKAPAAGDDEDWDFDEAELGDLRCDSDEYEPSGAAAGDDDDDDEDEPLDLKELDI